MSIRMVALEFYRVKKQVEELERKLKDLPPQSPERDRVAQELRSTQAEEKRLKAMLDGAKE
jgi:hypothetical protein